MTDQRAAGILLPIASLPSPHGIGDFGKNAYRFADFLQKSAQSLWQVLPVHPTNPSLGNSPYSSNSAFAGNPLYIDLINLQKRGYLSAGDLGDIPDFNEQQVDYEKVHDFKLRLLKRAFQTFKAAGTNPEFEEFCNEHSFWLEDFALYVAIKDKFDKKPWYEWPESYRDRGINVLNNAKKELADQIMEQKFYQYLFYTQWQMLKEYCNHRNIKIIGDIPIYVHGDSADTWSHQELFKLGENKQPTVVSGVPPDYFSETGQLWGNPVYDWDRLKKSGFEWWLKRLGHMFRLYDVLRIDHFRGLIAYWEVPAGEKTAINGKWVPVPYEEFFAAISDKFNGAPLMAEDLGSITDDVREARKRYGYPGMKILQFAFGADDPEHPYLPHNYKTDFAVYTGTHDNNTVLGWVEHDAGPEDKKRLFNYLGRKVPKEKIHIELTRLAFSSIAGWAIIPIQDIIGLGQEARINRPASSNGNWGWRLHREMLTDDITKILENMTRTYGRAPK